MVCGCRQDAHQQEQPRVVPVASNTLGMPSVPIRVCPGRTDQVVVLTFDDGPSPYTDRLLELLQQRNARATFFLKTNNLDEAHPEHAANRLRVGRIHAAGHEICNHTHSHRRLTQLNHADVRAEMLTAETLIASETGRRAQCMRPPYTDYDDGVLGILGELGYSVILWSFDTGDWLHASTEYPNDLDTDKVLRAVTDATNALTGPLIHIQHDNEYTEASVELVPIVIDRLRNAGWQVITLSECVGEAIDKPLE